MPRLAIGIVLIGLTAAQRPAAASPGDYTLLEGAGLRLAPVPNLGVPESRPRPSNSEPRPRSWRSLGSASELRGHVCVEHIFVDDPSSAWTDDRRQQSRAVSDAAFRHLARVAAERSIAVVWHEHETRYLSSVDIPTGSGDHAWTEMAVGTSVTPLGLYLPRASCPAFECQQRLAILHVAKVGRSYALPDGFSYDDHKERAVLFLRRVEIAGSYESEGSAVASLLLPERPASFVHEVLHVFGAEDLYQPASRAREAERRYPNDVMLQSNRGLDFVEIEAYTAHLIGWTDEQPPGLPVTPGD